MLRPLGRARSPSAPPRRASGGFTSGPLVCGMFRVLRRVPSRSPHSRSEPPLRPPSCARQRNMVSFSRFPLGGSCPFGEAALSPLHPQHPTPCEKRLIFDIPVAFRRWTGRHFGRVALVATKTGGAQFTVPASPPPEGARHKTAVRTGVRQRQALRNSV